MFRKSNRLPLILILVLVAFAFGYGHYVTGTAHALGAQLARVSPLVVFLLGLAVGKFLV